ncbi:MAG: branched-chain amino acid aminotransferase [Pseudomonadales bacterium]|nr:branched-chain amino acid aminotransferase [Pseudomonadales bacterium]
MSHYRISPDVMPTLAGFSLPEELGFGEVKVPIMYRADYTNGEWQSAQLTPYGNIEIDPAAKVLHYAQEVFEGLKAYRLGSQRANFFRPLENLKRINRSAERMCMIDIPESIWMDGISLMTAYSEPFIPNGSGKSLYLRPFLIGTKSNLGMGISDSFTFMVIASPSTIYHAGHMKIQIEREACRAARGGTGAAKTGGNYAAALQSAQQVQRRGYDQSLWLDPVEMKYIEELSGMNFFILQNGELHTPILNGSFLAGITRDSLITLAKHKGITVIERDIAIQEVLNGIETGAVSEIFACGTAAIVSPVSVIADADGRTYNVANVDQLAADLRQSLLAIQEGREADPFSWTSIVKEAYYPNV